MLLKRDQIPQGPYDVIVIGSGLGGLTSANILARMGKKVLLLEAHNKLGGLATWFYRSNKNHLFDVSLHGFPYGMIKSLRKYWNKELIQNIRPIQKVRFANEQFELDTSFTLEDYKHHLVHTFGLDTTTVERFFSDLQAINFYDHNGETIGEFFSRYFVGRNDVTRFLLEPMTYANGSTLEDPIISFAIVFLNFMKKGVYTFAGNTSEFIGLLKNELLTSGVDIKLNTEVQQLVIQEGKVCGVVTKKGTIESGSVISNAHLFSTINKLLPEVPEDISQKMSVVKNNTSSAQVYIGLKEGVSIPYEGELFFTSRASDFTTGELLHPQTTSRTYSFYHAKSRGEQCSRSAIVSSTNARYEDWANLSKEDYESQKKDLIDQTLEDLKKRLPSIFDSIDTVDAATPVTIKKYTRHVDGSSFGTKFEGLEVSRLLPQKVPGLYHCGSVGIIMSGWLGAANYGAIVANDVSSYLNQGSRQ